MASTLITHDMIVADVLNRFPQTIPVFQKYKMGCVGCAMAPFETLAEATAIYKIPLHRFLNDLQAAVQWHALLFLQTSPPTHHTRPNTEY